MNYDPLVKRASHEGHMHFEWNSCSSGRNGKTGGVCVHQPNVGITASHFKKKPLFIWALMHITRTMVQHKPCTSWVLFINKQSSSHLGHGSRTCSFGSYQYRQPGIFNIDPPRKSRTKSYGGRLPYDPFLLCLRRNISPLHWDEGHFNKWRYSHVVKYLVVECW